MIVLKVIIDIIAFVFVLYIFAFAIIGMQLLVWFQWKPCKHCGHTLEYKGLKEDKEEGHYLFHCPHCGAWEQIPKSTFLKNFIYKDYDPLNE